MVVYCPNCWDIVYNCDPLTGAWGVMSCDVRVPEPEELTRVTSETNSMETRNG